MIYSVGTAVRDITPSEALLAAGNIWLWGYGGRTQPCNHVDGAISARAIVIKDPVGAAIVLVSVDIGALDPAMTEFVRSQIMVGHREIAPQSICVNVSHTHYAPVAATIPTWQLGVGYVNGEYAGFLQSQIVGVIEDALQSCQAAKLEWARGLTNIGFDRHPIPNQNNYDPTLDVLRVSDPSGKVLAIVFSTACHPTSHPNGDDDGVSPDFPGVTRQLLEAKYGGVGMFLQGFAGTCNPLEGESDLNIGQMLFNSIVNVLQVPLVALSGPVASWLSSVDLPFHPLDSSILPGWLSWAQANSESADSVTSASAQFVFRWAAYMLSLRENYPASLPTPLQALRIGTPPRELYIAASGHEVTTDFGPRVRALWPFPHVTVLGYSNAQLSYLPSVNVLLNPDEAHYFPDWIKMAGNYEGGQAFMLYAHPGVLTNDVDSIFLGGHANLVQQTQFVPPGNVIYAVVQQQKPGSGHLVWYKHLGYQNGADQWLTSPAGYIGEGCGPDNLSSIFSGGGGIIYEISTSGHLVWNKHLGFQSGFDQWQTTPDPKGYIGEGWGPDNFSTVFGDSGIIYAIHNGGLLLWYKHLGFADGTDRWQTTPDPKGHIGEGWGPGNFSTVFGGCNGVIYAINKSGLLLWYKHLGFADGTDRWQTTPDPKGHIGEGWGPDNFPTVFGGRNGIIYAVDKNGNLHWYKHLGFEDGTDHWQTSPDPKGYIGEGWGSNNFSQVFC